MGSEGSFFRVQQAGSLRLGRHDHRLRDAQASRRYTPTIGREQTGNAVTITTCGDGSYYDDILATLLAKSLDSQP
jgi:hypothetical protein